MVKHVVKRLFIIDAMAMAFRAFYAFGGRPLTTASGLPVSAVYGSAMFMLKLITEQRPDYLAICADSAAPTFRHELYPAYKANRRDMPEDLAAQLPHFFRLLSCFGGKMLRQAGVEADDLIGTLARRLTKESEDLEVYIVSGDKDFMQLINDRIFLYTPKKADDALLIKREGVFQKFGCTPEQVIDCLALIGDASDNVPGVHGIGEKGAAKLIETFGTLDNIYARLSDVPNAKLRDALAQQRDKAYLSRELVTIKTDLDLACTLPDLAIDPERSTCNEALLGLCKELEFKALVTKLDARLSRSARPSLSLAATPPPPLTRRVPGELFPVEISSTELAAETSVLHTLAAVDTAAAAPIDVQEPERLNAAGYRLVDTPESLQGLIKVLAESKIFAFDSESTGLNIASDKPIGLSFASTPNEAYYLPLVPQHSSNLSRDAALAAVRPFLADPSKLKVGHNLKFDLQMLNNIGIEVVGPLRDTMIMNYLIDATSRQHGLDHCCLQHLNYEKVKTSTLIGNKGQFSMLAANAQILAEYACEDADLTLRLYEHLHKQIEALGLTSVLDQVEMPLVPILARMEQSGVFVDVANLRSFSAKLAVLADELEARVHELAGTEFNVNSPKQLQDVLFNQLKVHQQLGIKSLKKTKSGYSTDESVLSKLAAHPLPRAVLEYRGIAKLKGTYVDALPQLVNGATGRVHTSFHQTGTATGRLSSSEPNLQNIPIRSELGREIRKAFKAADDDRVIISADYSQIELRLLAHLAGEESLKQAFTAGQDIHRMTAARVFGMDEDQVDPATRSRAKAINFGIIYGMGPRRLSAETGVSMSEAASFIEKYFASYPGIERYIQESVANARSSGYSVTITGRRRRIDLDESRARFDRKGAVSAENIAVNTPIQGSAADLIKLAMIKIDEKLRARKLDARMLLQVHDELVFEAPKSQADEVKAIITDCMCSAMELSVPLDVQIKDGASWLEAH